MTDFLRKSPNSTLPSVVRPTHPILEQSTTATDGISYRLSHHNVVTRALMRLHRLKCLSTPRLPFHPIPSHSIPSHPTPSHSIPFHPLHCTVLYCTALYCTALYCTALHCTALHYTILIAPSRASLISPQNRMKSDSVLNSMDGSQLARRRLTYLQP